MNGKTNTVISLGGVGVSTAAIVAQGAELAKWISSCLGLVLVAAVLLSGCAPIVEDPTERAYYAAGAKIVLLRQRGCVKDADAFYLERFEHRYDRWALERINDELDVALNACGRTEAGKRNDFT